MAPPPSDVRVALLLGDLLGRMVALLLRHIEAECRVAGSRGGLDALRASWRPQVVLADIDEFSEAPQWAARVDGQPAIPCIGLTRRRQAQVKIEAFERGIADVIQVPFTPDEIVVRTYAVLRTASDGEPRPAIRERIRAGLFEMDLTGPGVRLDGQLLRLTPLQHTLLYLFLSHPGQVLTRESILANVWGHDSAVASNVIDRHIRDLRVKLGDSWQDPRFIETVPGRGYRLVGPADQVRA